MNQNQNDTKRFEKLLWAIREQLLLAQMHLDIWIAIFPTEQAVHVINAYRGFFIPTRIAHLNQFYITISNVLSNDIDAPSLYSLLVIVSRNTRLAQRIDVKAIKMRLKGKKDIMRRINNLRNKRAAHCDVNLDKPESVLLGESKALLSDLQDIYNQISGAYNGNQWSFIPLQHGDTERMIKLLSETIKMR